MPNTSFAVIFDLDGLIVDTEKVQSESLELLLKKYGEKPIYNENRLIHQVGVSGDQGYLYLKEKYNLTDSVEVLREKRRLLYAKLLEKKLIPFPGFFKLLDILEKKHIKKAVASNRFVEHIYLIVENLKIKNRFDVIVGPSRNVRHKPFPDIYLKTAEKLKVSPTLCIVLEDSLTGVTAAKDAGMKVIAIPNRYTHSQDLSKADKIVSSLSDVTMDLLKSL